MIRAQHSSFRACIAAALLPLLAGPAWSAAPQLGGPTLVAVDIFESELYGIDASSGAVTHLATVDAGLGALEYWLDGDLYGITIGDAPELHRIDGATFADSVVGPLGGTFFEGGLAIDPSGRAWAAAANQLPPYQLIEVDLATGATTVVGSLGQLDFNGLDLRSDGVLIGLERTTGALYEVDPETATSTHLADLPAAAGLVGGVAILGETGYYVTSGPLMLGSNELYRFDPFNGESTLVGPLTDGGQSQGGFSSLGEMRPSFYTSYCVSTVNSTGAAALLSASGSASTSAGDLRLHAVHVPNQPGIFFHAANAVQLPFGCSTLCAVGGSRRSAVAAGAGHYATYLYDGSDAQHSLADFVGQVRHFQFWLRDPQGAGACGFTFNLSDALFLTVEP